MFRSILKGLAALTAVAGTAILGYWLMNLLRDADQAQVAAQASASARDEQSGAGSEEDRRPRRDPNNPYCWLSRYDSAACLAARIPTPPGYERVEVDPDGFTCWLRHLPVKPAGSPVKLYNGRLKGNQNAHCAVIDIDVGNKDLQQCADAIIRLWAEYLYSRGRFGAIHFNFTSGETCEFVKWAEGIKPIVEGGLVSWTKPPRPLTRTSPKDLSYANFRGYLDTIFAYAGTQSLAGELRKVDVKFIRPGDVFIQGGNPGHAVIVLDMAESNKGGRRCFLLGQSFMPAQDIHVLKNPRPADQGIAPWYDVVFGQQLATPEWKFNRADLMRFK